MVPGPSHVARSRAPTASRAIHSLTNTSVLDSALAMGPDTIDETEIQSQFVKAIPPQERAEQDPEI